MTRLLRATIPPLLALAGLALLAWGVVSWWTFHRALFLEEVAAIEALAGTHGVVEYRRQGETTPHEFDAREGQRREAIPWSLPLVGRVEFIRVRESGFAGGFPPEALRDRALVLPGLRGYVDPALNYRYGFPPMGQEPQDLPFGQELPRLPEKSISLERLYEPFPEGEALTADETRSLAERIEAAWREPPSTRPRLEFVKQIDIIPEIEEFEPGLGADTHWRVDLLDGDLRLEIRSHGVYSQREEAFATSHLIVRNRDALYQATHEPTGWRTVAICDLDLPEAPQDDREDLERFASDPYELEIPYVFTPIADLLGPAGESVDRIERIDDVRYRLETKPWRSPRIPDRTIRLRVIVRRDMAWAIERFETFDDEPGDQPWSSVYAGIVRLDRVAGETVATERLCTEWNLEQGEAFDRSQQHGEEERTLIATVFDPDYPKSALDPRSYERDLPERRELPALRAYRILLLAGAACLVTATVGWVAGGRKRRLVRPIVVERASRPRLTLQFGFATLFAVALLVISLSGWVKRYIDDAQEQTALLAALTEGGVRLRVEREPPGFPWMFVSTDALPLDAPLQSVTSDGAPPPEALDRLLRLSPAVVYACEEPARADYPDANPNAENFHRQRAALQKAEAQADDVDWPDEPLDPFETRDLPFPLLRGMQREAEPLEQFPDGKRYTEASQAAVIDEAIVAWRKAGDATVRRYVVLEETHWDSDSDVRMTIRDGARFRMGEREYGVDWIECQDELFRRRFAWTDEDDWRLVLRRPLAVGEESLPIVTLRSAKEDGEQLLEAADPPPEEPPPVPYGRPVPAAGLPRAPYCLPPCLDSWAPPLNDALLRIEAGDVVGVTAIDPDRVRFDLLYPYAKMSDAPVPLHDEATPDHPWVVDWSIVVRMDLDWSVERCEYVDEFVRDVPVTAEVTTPSVVGMQTSVVATGAMRPARRRREVKIVNEFAADDSAAPYVGTLFDCKELDEGAYASGISGRALYAVDLSPDFPGPVFDRATVDSPDPPLPESESTLPWYLVTGTLACAGLVLLGARRTLFRAGQVRRKEGPA